MHSHTTRQYLEQLGQVGLAAAWRVDIYRLLETARYSQAVSAIKDK